MKRFLYSLLFLVAFAGASFGQSPEPTPQAISTWIKPLAWPSLMQALPVRVREVDGSPNVSAVSEMIFANGAITASGSKVTILAGAGAVTGDAALIPSGPTAWYKADSITGLADQAGVAQWNDSSGNGYHLTQATGVSQPLYKANGIHGPPAITISGNKNLTNASLPLNRQASTVIFVARPDKKGQIQIAIDIGATAYFLYGNYGNYEVGGASPRFGTGSPTDPGMGAVPDWHAIINVNDTGNAFLYRDSLSKTAAALSAGTNTGAIVGSTTAFGFAYQGDIAEIIIYPRAITAAERIQVQQYLDAKYGIATRYPKRNLLIAPGNSIGAGSYLTNNQANFIYKTSLGLSEDLVMLERAISGMTTSAINETPWRNYVKSYYDPERAINLALMWEGTNDLIFVNTDPTDCYNEIVAVCTAWRAMGYKVIVGTILPRGNSPSFWAARNTVNGLIRSNYLTFADGLFDPAANTTIGEDGDETNLTYYSDLIHLTDAGHTILAEVLTPVVNGLLPSGNVIAPASSVDNRLARFDGVTGRLLQGSSIASADDGATVVTSNNAACLEVGPNGSTNPVLRAVCSIASQSTGVTVTGRASGAGADLAVIGGGTNEDLTLTPKGTTGRLIGSATSFYIGGVGTSLQGLEYNAGTGVLTARSFGTAMLTMDGVSGSTRLGGASFQLTNSAGTSGFISPASAVWRLTNGGTGAGSLLIGPSTGAIGASSVGVIALINGTVPSASSTDGSNIYNADSAAADSNTFIRNEAGEINRLTGLASRNSAAFSKTSDAALTSITGIPRNVEANRTYAFRGNFQTTANVAGGIQFSVSGTATATAISYEGTLQAAAALVSQTRATALDTVVCASTTTTAGTCHIEGVIQIANAGTITITFAQNVSNGAASTVLANQYFALTPIN